MGYFLSMPHKHKKQKNLLLSRLKAAKIEIRAFSLSI
jgi:hypothetical protein